MKILCIGEILIDMICTDHDKTLAEGKTFIKKAGGAPANVAAAIASMGGQVELAARVGTDPFGTYLVDVMHSFGVDTKWIVQDASSFTTMAFVSMMEDGEHDFYFNRGADGQFSMEDAEKIELDDIAIIHFGSATAFLPGPLNAAYLRLLEKARERNIFISFDPNYRQQLFNNNKQRFIDQSWHFLKKCDFFKISEEEAMLLTGCDDWEKASSILTEKTNAAFAITLGKEGSLFGCHGKTCIVPGIKIRAIDTTGAGDAFTGAVLFQLSKKSKKEIAALSAEAWKEIIRNGNKAGAKTCEYVGAMEAFRHLGKTIFE